MREDEVPVDPCNGDTEGEVNLSFAAFSLLHARCGEGVIELRLEEHSLLEMCTACAVLEIFGPHDDVSRA